MTLEEMTALVTKYIAELDKAFLGLKEAGDDVLAAELQEAVDAIKGGVVADGSDLSKLFGAIQTVQSDMNTLDETFATDGELAQKVQQATEAFDLIDQNFLTALQNSPTKIELQAAVDTLSAETIGYANLGLAKVERVTQASFANATNPPMTTFLEGLATVQTYTAGAKQNIIVHLTDETPTATMTVLPAPVVGWPTEFSGTDQTTHELTMPTTPGIYEIQLSFKDIDGDEKYLYRLALMVDPAAE